MGIKPTDKNYGAMIRLTDLRNLEKRTPLAGLLRSSRSIPLPYVPLSEYPPGVVFSSPYFSRIEPIIKGKDQFATDMILRAFNFSAKVHSSQRRVSSGEPYIVHPIAVARMISDMGFGGEEIAAALLHDTIEDGGGEVTKELLIRKFGARLAEMVWDITELGKEPGYHGVKPSEEDIYRKIIRAKHLTSLIIKMCDRHNNLITLDYLGPEKIKQKAEESLYFYAKIADDWGMWEIKREIEDLSFKHVDPERFRKIKEMREQIRKESAEDVDRIMEYILKKFIEKETPVHGIRINKEERGIYELDERIKGEEHKKNIEDLSAADIWRLNVIVPNETLRRTIYFVEGFIQEHCYPVEKRENAISKRQLNDHRFLHFYLVVPRFGKLLMQIRDEAMWSNYRLGIASRLENGRLSSKEGARLLRSRREYLAREGSSAQGFFALARRGAIVVFTRGNKRIQLPRGSTVLDFIAVSEKEKLINAKITLINDIPVALSHKLRDGDVVIARTDEKARPKLEWLKWGQTLQAYDILHRYFSALPREQIIEGALEELQRELKGLRKAGEGNYLPVKPFLQTRFFKQCVGQFSRQSVEELLYQIGIGNIDAGKIVGKVMEKYFEAVSNHKGKKNEYTVSILADDRPGVLESIIEPLKEYRINISHGNFRKYNRKHKGKSRINMTFEITPEVQGLQHLLIRTIVARTKGVKQFNLVVKP